MSVSLAMIVKDEEQTLARCLESVRGCVDEIVIVDTGSTDATWEVALRYTDRIFSLPWPDHFAKARQYAFDQATGDWVFWLDADDEVRGADDIRQLAASAAPDIGGFYWRYICDRDRWGNPTCDFWRERLVRNDGSFRWQGRVHETLVAAREWQMPQSELVVVEHRSPPERAAARGPRNLRLLQRDYEESAGSPSPRLLFYLGKEYAGLGEVDAAVETLQQCAAASTWADERYLAYMELSALLRRSERYEDAIQADLSALKVCPHWPNAYFSLAQTYYFLQDWHKVVHWCEVGRAMPEPESVHFMDRTAFRYGWIIYYANALFHVGAPEEARAWTLRGLNHCPDDEQHLANLAFFSNRAAGVAS